ncbi:MAG TPA: AmmeMemoRadiSam system protein A [Dermatophilaceae bacterium]|jgi:AmmeMemoRadiSam system protein A
MHETWVSEHAESVGASPPVEDPTVATAQDPTARVVPDDAGDVLLSAARTAIAQTLGTTTSHAATVPHAGTTPAWAFKPGASFVTLKKNGRLRGCIGSFAAQRPLLEDVRANAVAAAMRDPRFAPMTPDELPAVAIEVSVLSAPQPLRVSSLGEAYDALRPGVDGVIVETGAYHRATLLPQMWQVLPDPEQFLGHLWLKAGLVPGVWHEGTTLQTYTVRAWHEIPETSRG